MRCDEKSQSISSRLRFSHLHFLIFLFKLLRHALQQISNLQMLGTDLLTFATADAVAGFAVVNRMDILVIIVGVPVMEYFFCVHTGE